VNAILTKLAARLGLVPAHRYDSMRRAIDESRAGSSAWKEKAGELSKKFENSEAERTRQTRQLRHAREELQRLRQREAEFDRLREQITQTEQALVLAREQLMAVEVKLDILEGAANVLDARTRTSPQRQPGPATGAAV
jgi:chromosome segregation ATPase